MASALKDYKIFREKTFDLFSIQKSSGKKIFFKKISNIYSIITVTN